MEAPKKIYVTIDRPQEIIEENPELVGVAWSEKDDSCEHIEYIRKDALLEWAKNEIIKADMAMETGDGHAIWGQRNMCKQLIDKLNSL